MKKIFSFIIFIGLSININATTLQQLEKDNIKKPILVLVSQKHCKYCTIQKEIFKDAELKKYINKNFQYLEINRSLSLVPSKLNASVSPMLFVLTKDGEVIKSFRGAQEKRPLMKNLNRILKDISSYDDIDTQLNDMIN